MRIIAPLLKMGLSGGAIYVVANQGVFSISQKETIEASKQISNSLHGLDSYFDRVKIPVGLSKQDFVEYWNTGVLVTIGALASLPSDSKELASRGLNYLKQEIGKQIK
ncbi:MICOS complex subunit MIC13 [Trichonephila inaurata madagascariensis]|uniref:MICOS complex subunit MIC13 n=1 Tax=Trichonephila inaurata madagascariensis TaxID=2747483 RepID=A0A8X6Y0J5_9ARAC|nr:MICOS complex subunit MIC13 [Trichonephila inaurata madagascariensis]